MAPDDETRDAVGPRPMLGELLGLIPKLADRTRRQAEFSMRALSHLPCIGGRLSRLPEGSEVPAHEASQPTDVLSVLRSGDDAGDDVAGPSAGTQSPGDQGDRPGSRPDEPVPDVASLPIPGYESLAASQVIPRLEALSSEDLKAVGAYERANRHRQTILHRVAQLLAS